MFIGVFCMFPKRPEATALDTSGRPTTETFVSLTEWVARKLGSISIAAAVMNWLESEYVFFVRRLSIATAPDHRAASGEPQEAGGSRTRRGGQR